jgi:hypothetical protein
MSEINGHLNTIEGLLIGMYVMLGIWFVLWFFR